MGAIRLNAYVVQNVVTYDTVIDFENPDGRLFPGETAYVTLPTGHVENVLEIPNAALTYRRTCRRRTSAAYRRFGIPEAALISHTGGRSWSGSSPPAGLQPVLVKVGISDFANTQLAEGNLKAGDLLVTGAMNAAAGDGKGKPPRPPVAGNAGRGR